MSKILDFRAVSVVAGLAYAVIIYMNLPMFRYYPMVGMFSVTDIPGQANGPAMLWYGWMAWAAVAGIIGGLILRPAIMDKIGNWILWVVPFVMFAAGFYREQDWFFR
jgi:hypothetical protein